MAINPYFDFYNASNEQDLYEDLIIESIRYAGFNTYYMPRVLENFDGIFREATVSSYEDVFLIEAYLKSNMKFEGDGKFMSQELGLEIRDQTVFTISQKVFRETTGLDRPLEGSVVYLPLDKKLYEIKFVNHQDVFYQLGKLMVWDLECELLEYAGEQFNTGIPEIDAIGTESDRDDNINNQIEEWTDQTDEVQTESDKLLDWTEKDPFGNGGTL